MRIALLICAAVCGLTGLAAAVAETGASAASDAGLRRLADFTAIADEKERSLALFTEIGKVLQHPRCLNCHPAGDSPTQTDRMTPHAPMVVRGDGNAGAPGLYCNTCHQAENYDVSGVPGDPMWALAPIEMAWQGKSLGAICAQIKDPERNGGKDMDALIHHMAEDHLVGWGWRPGKGRTAAPGTQAEFGALFKAWAESGAVCPDA